MCEAVCVRGEFYRATPEEEIKRPKIEGLPESMSELLGVCARNPHYQGSGASRMDPEQYRFVIQRIVTGRALYKKLESTTRWVYADVAHYEQLGADMVERDYNRIVALDGGNTLLMDALEEAEEYLHGSGRRGAETRTHNKGMKNRLTTDVGKNAHAAGLLEGKKAATEELVALIQQVTGKK
jgi:hypothetical protein